MLLSETNVWVQNKLKDFKMCQFQNALGLWWMAEWKLHCVLVFCCSLNNSSVIGKDCLSLCLKTGQFGGELHIQEHRAVVTYCHLLGTEGKHPRELNGSNRTTFQNTRFGTSWVFY